jgi:hypothetical protein
LIQPIVSNTFQNMNSVKNKEHQVARKVWVVYSVFKRRPIGKVLECLGIHLIVASNNANNNEAIRLY